MYDEAKADRVIKFIERITTHTKGELAKQPFILEPFQKEVIRDIFGNVNEEGLRITREAFPAVARSIARQPRSVKAATRSGSVSRTPMRQE